MVGCFLCVFSFWLHCAACGILVPRPRIEPGPLAVRVWGPNHWIARKFPGIFFNKLTYFFKVLLK